MPNPAADPPPRAPARRPPGPAAAWLAVPLALLTCVLLTAAGLPPSSPRAAPSPAPSVGEFTLAASEVVLDGLRIHGVGPAPATPGTGRRCA